MTVSAKIRPTLYACYAAKPKLVIENQYATRHKKASLHERSLDCCETCTDSKKINDFNIVIFYLVSAVNIIKNNVKMNSEW